MKGIGLRSRQRITSRIEQAGLLAKHLAAWEPPLLRELILLRALSDAQLDLIQGLAKKVNDSSYSVEVLARFAVTDSPTANLAMTSISL